MTSSVQYFESCWFWRAFLCLMAIHSLLSPPCPSYIEFSWFNRILRKETIFALNVRPGREYSDHRLNIF